MASQSARVSGRRPKPRHSSVLCVLFIVLCVYTGSPQSVYVWPASLCASIFLLGCALNQIAAVQYGRRCSCLVLCCACNHGLSRGDVPNCKATWVQLGALLSTGCPNRAALLYHLVICTLTCTWGRWHAVLPPAPQFCRTVCSTPPSDSSSICLPCLLDV